MDGERLSASFNEQLNSRIERKKKLRGFASFCQRKAMDDTIVVVAELKLARHGSRV
jgi:hypothetical protein